MTGKAPSTPAMEAAREIHEHEVKRRSKSAVVIHVDCEAKILAIAAILDRHFPSREPQGAQRFEEWWNSDDCTGATVPDKLLMKLAWQAAQASRDRELREMREALQDQIVWLKHYLTQLVHVSVKDDRSGNTTNGFAAAQIPDWAIKQKLDDLEAVARAERVREAK